MTESSHQVPVNPADDVPQARQLNIETLERAILRTRLAFAPPLGKLNLLACPT